MDKKLIIAKEEFKQSYGFSTHGLFEIISRYFKISGIIATLGSILAALAALISVEPVRKFLLG